MKLVLAVAAAWLTFGSAPAAAADIRARFIEGADGVPLSVRESGPADGVGILFIHGLGQGAVSFDKQFKSLGPRYHLVAFDLRGHGLSGKPWAADAYVSPKTWAADVAAVVKATGLKKPIVVGWSYGTGVAMDYVREYGSEAVSGVVLVGALGGLTPPPATTANPPPLPASYAKAKELQQSPLIEDQMQAAVVIGTYLTDKPVDDGLDAVSLQLGAMIPPYVRAGLMRKKTANQDLVSALRVPVLIARGDRDPSAPADASAALAKALPDATVVTFAGSGHSPFREDAAAFDVALTRFVESASKRSRATPAKR